MVKKRKAATAAAPSSTQPKKILKKKQPADEQPPPKVVEEEQPQPPQETPVELPVAAAVAAAVEEPEKESEPEQEEVEEEVEEEYEEEEVEEEEEIEEDEDEEIEEQGEEEEEQDQDQEPISMLIEPFTKEQLMMLVREAAEKHPDVASKVRKVADQDTVHRKIFVHGLGWDTTADTLRSAFKEYGEIEDCKAVADKLTGKSKGYGFILFKSRTGAKKALKEPQKLIAGRMTACQLAALGPVANSGASGSSYGGGSGGGGSGSGGGGYQTEYTQRKIYISNVSAELDPGKLLAYFSKFGEIEEGPLGIDKSTGKFKGFCLFVYKSVESARKALEEPHKQYEGVTLHCQRAIDGPKPGKGGGGGQHHSGGHGRVGGYVRGENPNLAGAIGGPPATAAGLMGQSVGGVPGFNAAAGAAGLNPALGQALTALLASQGAGLGLNNLLGTLGGGMGAPGVGAAAHMGQGGYGVQGGMGPVLGGYQGLQGAYPNQQMGQGGSGRSQHGYNGTHYGGH